MEADVGLQCARTLRQLAAQAGRPMGGDRDHCELKLGAVSAATLPPWELGRAEFAALCVVASGDVRPELREGKFVSGGKAARGAFAWETVWLASGGMPWTSPGQKAVGAAGWAPPKHDARALLRLLIGWV